MTKIESFFRLPVDSRKQDKQNDIDSQRENWMRQVELSLMSDLNRHGEFTATSMHPTALLAKQASENTSWAKENLIEPSPGAHHEASSGLAATAFKRHVYATSATVTHDQETPAKLARPEIQDNSNPGQAKQALDSGIVPTKSNSLHASAKSDADGTPSETTQATQVSNIVGWQMRSVLAQPHAAAKVAGLQIYTAQDCVASGNIDSEATVNNLPGRVATTNTPQMNLLRSSGLTPAGMKVLEEKSDELQADQTEADTGPDHANDDMGAEKQVWQKRMMHLTTEEQSVRVWIRDQNIVPAESAHLIEQLADEIAQSGLRLNTATINGKLIFENSADNGETEWSAVSETNVSSSGTNISSLDMLTSLNKGQKHGAR